MKTQRLTAAVATVAATVIGLVLATAPARAHHAFSAEFDADRPILLEGKVVRVEWINPHSWIHIEVVNDDGTKDVWMMEAGTPNTLFRRGMKPDSLPIGTAVVIRGYQAKSGALAGAGRDITYADGRKMFLGSSGTGAPKDGADPGEPPDAE